MSEEKNLEEKLNEIREQLHCLNVKVDRNRASTAFGDDFAKAGLKITPDGGAYKKPRHWPSVVIASVFSLILGFVILSNYIQIRTIESNLVTKEERDDRRSVIDKRLDAMERRLEILTPAIPPDEDGR